MSLRETKKTPSLRRNRLGNSLSRAKRSDLNLLFDEMATLPLVARHDSVTMIIAFVLEMYLNILRNLGAISFLTGQSQKQGRAGGKSLQLLQHKGAEFSRGQYGQRLKPWRQ